MALVERCVGLARLLVAGTLVEGEVPRGGRKAHELDTHAQLHTKETAESQ